MTDARSPEIHAVVHRRGAAPRQKRPGARDNTGNPLGTTPAGPRPGASRDHHSARLITRKRSRRGAGAVGGGCSGRAMSSSRSRSARPSSAGCTRSAWCRVRRGSAPRHPHQTAWRRRSAGFWMPPSPFQGRGSAELEQPAVRTARHAGCRAWPIDTSDSASGAQRRLRWCRGPGSPDRLPGN